MSDYSDIVQRLRADLVQRLRGNPVKWSDSKEAANVIELLQRELKCSEELWEQQQELALEYLADIEKANERIKDLEAALKPFAKAANDHSENTPNYREAEAYFTLGQLRAAREVLGEK
jgi:tetratricopeptide (TPR) repeat protein